MMRLTLPSSHVDSAIRNGDRDRGTDDTGLGVGNRVVWKEKVQAPFLVLAK